MLERISDIKPFNYDELINYCKQFPSVTLSDLGRRSYFAHLRYGKGQPVRDLDGQQLRILLESFGIKVHARIMHYSFDYNLRLNTDCYVDDLDDTTLPIVFPNFLAGGAYNDGWIWLHDLVESGRPFLWWYNDMGNAPWSNQWTRVHPKMADVKTIGMISACTYRINFNSDLIKSSDIEPTINKFCWASATARPDIKNRMRYLTPEYTECHGIREQKVINGFTFLGQVKSDELVDLYSQYYATLFSTSSVDILNNITPRLYETMCSNAVVFFDTASDLEMESWEFRKVTSKEDAISKLQYVIEHPEFRKELIDEQHSYIRLVDEKLNSFR